MYICVYVCMYVCTVVIPYYILIQNYMTFSKMQTSAHTSSHRPMPCFQHFVSSSFNMDSGSEDTAEEKRQSKLDDEEKHR